MGRSFSVVLSYKGIKYDMHILAVNWKQEVERGLAMPFGLKALPWRAEGFVDAGRRDDVTQLVPELQLFIKADVPYDYSDAYSREKQYNFQSITT